MAWSITEARNQFFKSRSSGRAAGASDDCRSRLGGGRRPADNESVRDSKWPKDFKEFLLSGPSWHELDLERDP